MDKTNKKVFCVIGDRCKVIRYKKSCLSDAAEIRQALVDACKTDFSLKAMIENKIIILQKKDEDRNNQLRDIEDDDEIDDKEDVHVILMEMPQTVTVSDLMSTDILAHDEVMTMDLPIVCSQSTKIIETSVNEMDPSPDCEILSCHKLKNNSVDSNTTKYDTLLDEDENGPVKKRLKLDNKFMNMPSTSKETCKLNGPGTITYPAALPQLDDHLKKLLNTTGIVNHANTFISFWSAELQRRTNDKPTKSDYENYCRSIVDVYPMLKGGPKYNVSASSLLKLQMSQCIRNRRAFLKRKLNNCSEKKTGNSTSNAALIVTDVLQSTPSDINTGLKELKKNKNSQDSAHVRRLMQETSSIRREWIEKEAKRISEVVNEYSQLKDYNLILFEFSTLRRKSLNDIFQNVDTLLEKLASFFKVEATTEEEKCTILIKLYDQLLQKKFKNSATSLFIVKKAQSSTEDLITLENESPRVVLYIAEAGIATAFIVADETVRVKIPEPTVQKTIISLLACYYVWDTKYPSAYLNLLEYIDHEVLGTVPTKNSIVGKFIRKVNYEHEKPMTT